MIPKASEDLYGYKRWRKNLIPLETETVLHWTKDYNGDTLRNSIKAGQYTKITYVRKSNGISDMATADWVYTLVLCTKDGKEFKKTFYWRVEGIARHLDAGDIEVAV